MPADSPQGLQILSTIIAVVGGGIALFRTFPDRRRQRFREQHQTLVTLLGPSDQPRHELIVESAFRASFEAALPTSTIKLLLDNRFSLLDIEHYCDVREYLTLDEGRSTFEFKRRRHRAAWARWAIIALWSGGYAALVFLAIAALSRRGANPLGQAALFFALIALGLVFLHQGSVLYRAGRFVAEANKRNRPRSPRVAA